LRDAGRRRMSRPATPTRYTWRGLGGVKNAGPGNRRVSGTLSRRCRSSDSRQRVGGGRGTASQGPVSARTALAAGRLARQRAGHPKARRTISFRLYRRRGEAANRGHRRQRRDEAGSWEKEFDKAARAAAVRELRPFLRPSRDSSSKILHPPDGLLICDHYGGTAGSAYSGMPQGAWGVSMRWKHACNFGALFAQFGRTARGGAAFAASARSGQPFPSWVERFEGAATSAVPGPMAD